MKITKSYLKRVIKEELQRILAEAGGAPIEDFWSIEALEVELREVLGFLDSIHGVQNEGSTVLVGGEPISPDLLGRTGSLFKIANSIRMAVLQGPESVVARDAQAELEGEGP